MQERPIQHLMCMGVPRSGTTFTAALLSSHEQVICGSERFPDPDAYTPELFSEHGFLHMRTGDGNYSRHLHLKEKFAQARVIGDKFPRAYRVLHRVLPRFDGAKVIFLVRDPHDVCASWNARAADATDAAWFRGQVGAFSVMEQLHAWSQLLQVEPRHRGDVLLVSYQSLTTTAGQAAAAGRMFEFLGVGHSAGTEGFLASEQLKTVEARVKRRSIAPVEQRLIELAGIDPLSRELEKSLFTKLEQFQPTIASVLAGFPARADEFWSQFEAALAQYPNRDACFDFGCKQLEKLQASDPGSFTRPVLDSLLAPRRADACTVYLRGLAGTATDPAAELQALVERFPGAGRPARMLGRLLLKEGKPEQALPLFERALAAEPADRGLVNSCAIALNRLGQADRALPMAQGIVAAKPNEVGFRFTLAETLLLLGQFPETEQQLQQIVALAPQHARLAPFTKRLNAARRRAKVADD